MPCLQESMDGQVVKMMVSYGRTGSVLQEVELLKPGVGKTTCIECGGSGWWNFGPPEEDSDCVVLQRYREDLCEYLLKDNGNNNHAA